MICEYCSEVTEMTCDECHDAICPACAVEAGFGDFLCEPCADEVFAEEE